MFVLTLCLCFFRGGRNPVSLDFRCSSGQGSGSIIAGGAYKVTGVFTYPWDLSFRGTR